VLDGERIKTRKKNDYRYFKIHLSYLLVPVYIPLFQNINKLTENQKKDHIILVHLLGVIFQRPLLDRNLKWIYGIMN